MMEFGHPFISFDVTSVESFTDYLSSLICVLYRDLGSGTEASMILNCEEILSGHWATPANEIVSALCGISC